MFKFINPKVEILTNRIKDLELINERMIGENSYLKSELIRVLSERDTLQNKLFDSVGLNKQQPQERIILNQTPIQVGAKHSNWAKSKQTLEQKAQEEWFRKNREVVGETIVSLETDLGIDKTN